MVDPLRFFGPREWCTSAVLVLLVFVPLAVRIIDEPYYLSLVSRIMILALAAVGLNLVLGYGGMVSFGHALYVGLGAYAVGVSSVHGITSGWAHLGVALLVNSLVAAAVGAVVLRTSGMAFIMITLAFAQMVYSVAVGARDYGGADGLQIDARSDFGLLDLANETGFYYLVLGCLLAVLFGMSRLVHSRFGMVLQGTRVNERRMAAMGFACFRYRLLAYVLSAQIASLAGVLLANLTNFVSPSYMQWTLSGELIVIVVLGGMGTLAGPIVGAAVLLLLEEALSSMNLPLVGGLGTAFSDYRLALVGVFIVAVTLSLERGLLGSLRSAREPR
ncbi:MAG: branched-chain amino acid ABC transporter permease [Burkholderiaceae bacterium]|nr:branched-chain amino acid ABC transporter permease [Burkholderiaceae bacterium]